MSATSQERTAELALNYALYGEDDQVRDVLQSVDHQELVVLAWSADRLATLAREAIEHNIMRNRAARRNEQETLR